MVGGSLRLEECPTIIPTQDGRGPEGLVILPMLHRRYHHLVDDCGGTHPTLANSVWEIARRRPESTSGEMRVRSGQHRLPGTSHLTR